MILNSEEFSDELKLSLDGISKSLVLASAFIKSQAFESIFGNLESNINVKVISRWKVEDLVMGSSDLEVYKYCKEKGWKFGINTRLHGKLFLLDNQEVFLGSANVTSRGFNLIERSNLEFGTKFNPSKDDLDSLNLFLANEVYWISDADFETMTRHVEKAKLNYERRSIEEWPASIMNRINLQDDTLWLKDLFTLSPEEILINPSSDESTRHINLMYISIEGLDSKKIKEGFRNTKIYAWAIKRLSGYDSVQFGTLKSDISKLLLDEPPLERKNLTRYVDILFCWFEYLNDEFKVTKRSHGGRGSRTVRLGIDNE